MTLAVQAIWPEEAAGASPMQASMRPLVAPSNIVTMRVSVTVGSYFDTQNFAASAGTASITGVPVGSGSLTLAALDAGPTVIYSGTNTFNGTAGAVVPVTVVLAPDGGQTVPPWPPTNVQATAGDSSATLTWDAVTTATGYAVYYGTNPASLGAGPSTTATATVIGSLTNDTLYYFAVTASNGDGESDASTTVSATPTSSGGAAYTLTVSKTGAGTGTVTSATAGITCGADCTEVYNENTSVVLTAAADAGSTFTGWSGGGCSGTTPCAVTVTANSTVTATFTLNQYTIGGSITGLTGTVVLQNNLTDDLTRTTNTTFSFATSINHGSSYSVTVKTQPTGQTCVVGSATGTVNAANVTDVTVTCTTDTYTLTVTKNGNAAAIGTVTSVPVGIDCGGDCAELYDYGTSVTLTAVAGVESSFGTWFGGICSGTSTCSVTVTADTTVGANFNLNVYSIGGSITGLLGTGLVLRKNGGSDLPITGNGNFAIGGLPQGSSYEVTVLSHPSGPAQTCALTNGIGVVDGADVTDVLVDCTAGPALYHSGADWNSYVLNNGFDIFGADDTACDGTETGGYEACIHGRELRVFEIPSLASCATVVDIQDNLGAFNWFCDDSTGQALAISSGLVDGMYLSDLIDFVTPGWLANAVQVDTGGGLSPIPSPSPWWGNPIVLDNNGMTAGTAVAGTIYVKNNATVAQYIIDADRVGFVVAPGVVFAGPPSASVPLIKSEVASPNFLHFLWLEGELDGTGNGPAVWWGRVKFSVMRNIYVSGVTTCPTGGLPGGWCPIAVYLGDSASNLLEDVTAEANAGYGGIQLYGSTDNTLRGVAAGDNASYGIFIKNSSSNNLLIDVIASENTNNGITIASSSTGNRLVNAVATNNHSAGITVESGSNATTLYNVTATNNGAYGVYLDASTGHALLDVTVANNRGDGLRLISAAQSLVFNVTAVNNYGTGVFLSTGGSVSLFNVASTNNRQNGVYLNASSGNYFTGLLKLGENTDATNGDCRLSTGLIDGGIFADCSAQGSSDFTPTLSVNLASAFKWGVYTPDTANLSDSSGGAIVTNITDWFSFDNEYRGWGAEQTGAINLVGATNFQWMERCRTGGVINCRIWDWSMASGDSVIREVNAPPADGNDTLAAPWSAGVIFLRNAVEIMDDDVGDDDGLCESNEDCLFTPNIGSYQGHISADPAAGCLALSLTLVDDVCLVGTIDASGTVKNVTLYRYDTNGR